MRLLCGVKGGSVGQSVLLGWTSPQQVEHLLACHQGFQYIDTTNRLMFPSIALDQTVFFLRARMTVTKEAFILDIRDPKTKTFTCDDGILGVGSITFQFSTIRGYEFMGHHAPLIQGRCRIPNQESHQFFAKPVIRKHLHVEHHHHRWRAHFWVIWSLIVPFGGNLVIRWPLCDLCMALVWLSFQNSKW